MQTDLLSDTVSSRQSSKIFDYVLDGVNSVNKQRCVDEVNCRSIPDKRGVDTESQLRGLGQFLNKLPNTQPIETIREDDTTQYNDTTLIDRDDIYWNNFNQSTRVPKSCDVLSGVTIDRFEYQHQDLQKPQLTLKMIPKDTRIAFKDRNNN
jgi:hypothetical protein